MQNYECSATAKRRSFEEIIPSELGLAQNRNCSAGLKSSPRLRDLFRQVEAERSDKQQQEGNSLNLGPTFLPTPVLQARQERDERKDGPSYFASVIKLL